MWKFSLAYHLNRKENIFITHVCSFFTDLGSRIGHQLGRVEIIAVQRRAARVPVPSGAGAKRLREIQSHVNRVAYLLNGALRQQVDMLIVRVVVILGRFRERRARSLRQSNPRLRIVTPRKDIQTLSARRLPMAIHIGAIYEEKT